MTQPEAPPVNYQLVPRSKFLLRTPELLLGSLAALITIGGYALTALVDKSYLPKQLPSLLVLMIVLIVIAHVAVWIWAPRSDATLLPLAVLLNGIGFIIISRLDKSEAQAQALWTALGIAAFVITLVFIRRTTSLHRYRYTFAFLGLIAIMLPTIPGIGTEINGARLWIRLGSFSFQPGEAAKVFLTIFIASYLTDTRKLLSTSRRSVGKLFIPDIKFFGPLLVAWGTSILVMVRQKDLGSSLLFFAVFAAMLYIATNRVSYLATGLVFFSGAATVAYKLFGHVRVRVETWIDPWASPQDEGFQLLQSLFSFGTGGVKGTGLGLGTPNKIPNASTDFVFSAVGEELGLVGTIAVIIALLLFVASGYRIATRAQRPFAQLFAAGLTTIIGVQTFVILGGVTRVIPLTGVTLPFVSYGGSSLVANYVICALLLRISDETARDSLNSETTVVVDNDRKSKQSSSR
ncbi:MAG TPA: putative peptidoglycan glycosyltransferase FtsW [Acidimicrobiia bacterium]|mgnify:CR=1 FL=1|nr:putative peptidoglycan glycosyltransferase FtsW [Acidimicrobiia bacterium]